MGSCAKLDTVFQQVKGGDFFPLLGTGEATLAVLGSVLASSV